MVNVTFRIVKANKKLFFTGISGVKTGAGGFAGKKKAIPCTVAKTDCPAFSLPFYCENRRFVYNVGIRKEVRRRAV